MVTKADVRAFLDRRWDLVRESKDRYYASLVERDGPDAAFEIANMLRAQAEAMELAPSRADREADLAAAVNLRKRLDRAERRSNRHR